MTPLLQATARGFWGPCAAVLSQTGFRVAKTTLHDPPLGATGKARKRPRHGVPRRASPGRGSPAQGCCLPPLAWPPRVPSAPAPCQGGPRPRSRELPAHGPQRVARAPAAWPPAFPARHAQPGARGPGKLWAAHSPFPAPPWGSVYDTSGRRVLGSQGTGRGIQAQANSRDRGRRAPVHTSVSFLTFPGGSCALDVLGEFVPGPSPCPAQGPGGWSPSPPALTVGPQGWAGHAPASDHCALPQSSGHSTGSSLTAPPDPIRPQVGTFVIDPCESTFRPS